MEDTMMNVNEEYEAGINLSINNKMALTVDMTGPVNQSKTETLGSVKRSLNKFLSLNLMSISWWILKFMNFLDILASHNTAYNFNLKDRQDWAVKYFK